jgi:hypothetical protein
MAQVLAFAALRPLPSPTPRSHLADLAYLARHDPGLHAYVLRLTHELATDLNHEKRRPAP